jgi:MFS family permease
MELILISDTLTTEHADPASNGAAFWRIAAFLAVSVIIGSFIGALTGEKTTFLFKDVMHLTPGDIGTLGIITGIPAYIQPFMGAGADLFPLFGSHRRSYFLLGTLVLAASNWGLACLHQYSYVAVVCLLLLTGSGGTLAGVMVNAVMVAIGNRTGRFSQLQSLLVFIPSVLSIVGLAHLSGYVTQHWSYHRAYGDAALLILLSAPLVLLLDERRATIRTGEAEARRQAAREERAHSAAALRGAVRSPGLWAVVGFVFYLIVTPGTGNAQIYYMTDVLHLSKQFIGSLGAFGATGSILAMILFAAGARRMPVWVLVWGAWLMDCCLYPTSLILHDPTSAKALYFLQAFVGVLYGLCLNTLAARACPPGVEGAVYGLVLSAIAFAGVLSNWIGGKAYDFLGPLNSAHHWTYTHSWVYSQWFGLAFTLVGFVFIPFLPAWARSREPAGTPRAEAAP